MLFKTRISLFNRVLFWATYLLGRKVSGINSPGSVVACLRLLQSGLMFKSVAEKSKRGC